MSEKRTMTVRVFPGFWGLLTLLFVAAKIGGYITWSWWLVFAPLFAPVVILGTMLVVGLGLVLAGAVLKK